MTRTDLLEVLCAETVQMTKDIILPVSVQREDEYQTSRAAVVHKMRLPDGKSTEKKAPYIIHQIITGKDSQQNGERARGFTTIRSIFCVYSSDGEEGSLNLLNLMERCRIGLLQKVLIGQKYTLNLNEGIEVLIYPDDTSPYYLGEMVTTWTMPNIEREVPGWP